MTGGVESSLAEVGELAELRQPRLQRVGLRRAGEPADHFLGQLDGLGEALALDQQLDPNLVLLPLLDLGVGRDRLELPADAVGPGVVGELLEQPLRVGQRRPPLPAVDVGLHLLVEPVQRAVAVRLVLAVHLRQQAPAVGAVGEVADELVRPSRSRGPTALACTSSRTCCSAWNSASGSAACARAMELGSRLLRPTRRRGTATPGRQALVGAGPPAGAAQADARGPARPAAGRRRSWRSRWRRCSSSIRAASRISSRSAMIRSFNAHRRAARPGVADADGGGCVAATPVPASGSGTSIGSGSGSASGRRRLPATIASGSRVRAVRGGWSREATLPTASSRSAICRHLGRCDRWRPPRRCRERSLTPQQQRADARPDPPQRHPPAIIAAAADRAGDQRRHQVRAIEKRGRRGSSNPRMTPAQIATAEKTGRRRLNAERGPMRVSLQGRQYTAAAADAECRRDSSCEQHAAQRSALRTQHFCQNGSVCVERFSNRVVLFMNVSFTVPGRPVALLGDDDLGDVVRAGSPARSCGSSPRGAGA